MTEHYLVRNSGILDSDGKREEKHIVLLNTQLTKEATSTICMLESRDKEKWLAKILQEPEVTGTEQIIKKSSNS